MWWGDLMGRQAHVRPRNLRPDLKGTLMSTALLDLPPVTADDVAAAEDRLARLLGTERDVVLIQAEATAALEAVARTVSGPHAPAVNVVTGPYGAVFGRWLVNGGSSVTTVQVPFTRAVDPGDVRKALRESGARVLSVVHAEAATGTVNPLLELARIAADHQALLVVDAVASIGAEPLDVDRLGAAVVVIGAQKALAGPAGVSAVVVNDDAWVTLNANPYAPRGSFLSLTDLYRGWVTAGRRRLPATANSLETRAWSAALERIRQEGLDAVVQRHQHSAALTRTYLRERGLRLWAEDNAAAGVATTAALPSGRRADQVVAAARRAGSSLVGLAPHGVGESVLRVNHTGRAAQPHLLTAELDLLSPILTVR